VVVGCGSPLVREQVGVTLWFLACLFSTTLADFCTPSPLGDVGATIGGEGVDSLQRLRLSEGDYHLVRE